jgi:hypothetical protein
MWTVNQNDSFQLPVAFKDEAGTAVVPTSISYQVIDVETGTIVRGATAVTPSASSITLTLTYDDTALVQSGRRSEERAVRVTAVYGTDASGDPIQKTDEYSFLVVKLGLTTLTRLKLALGKSVSDTSEDDRLLTLLDAAEATVARYLNRNLLQATYTEYFSGTGRPSLVLSHRPVVSVTGVYIDPVGYYGQSVGGFAASTMLTQGQDYALTNPNAGERNPGILQMLSALWDGTGLSNWPQGQGNIKVVYVAGYTQVPADVSQAVAMIVGQMLAQSDKGLPMQSETLGEYSYTLLTGAPGQLMAGARQLLNNYREVCV